MRKQGHYHQAEQEYRAALQEAEEFGENDPRRAKVLENLGELRILRGDYPDAERCLRLALSLENQVYGEEHAEVGITLNNLARSLHHQGKLEEGARLLQRACDILQSHLGANNHETANCIDNLAVFLSDSGEMAVLYATSDCTRSAPRAIRTRRRLQCRQSGHTPKSPAAECWP